MAKKEGSKKNIAERVRPLVEQVIVDLGYILWDVEYKKEGAEYNLILTLDRDGEEITIDDCVRVTDAVNPILDEADPISDSYCLEVSSAGLERELVREEHFEKYIGKEVEVKLFAPHEMLGKTFVLPLLKSTPETLAFKKDDTEILLEKSQIASVKTYVDYEKLFRESRENEEA